MNDSSNKHKYLEDGFELDEFKNNFQILKLKNKQIREDKRTIKLLYVASGILIIMAVFFSYRFICDYNELSRNAEVAEKAREIASPKPVGAEISQQVQNSSGELSEAKDSAEESTAAPVAGERQVLDTIQNLRDTFSNDDIIAYLKIDGTNIDYAVAQANDNEFYLNHDLYTEENVAGSIFMDYENNVSELDRNTVIYGHNMRNGSMFHDLRNYADESYYNEHRYILLTTPYEETRWEVFAFCETDTDFNYIQVIFPDDASFLSLVSDIKEISLYDTGVEVGKNDRILTLSTCANTTDNARLTLSAKLLE